MPNCRGGERGVGGGFVIKCFREKINGNFAQNLQNGPLLQLLQLGTKGLLFKVYNRLKTNYEI